MHNHWCVHYWLHKDTVACKVVMNEQSVEHSSLDWPTKHICMFYKSILVPKVLHPLSMRIVIDYIALTFLSQMK